MGVAEGFEELVAIIENGSVTGAAEQLGLPRPTVSRRLARLEERLGVRLLHRTTRRLALTQQGEALYAKARLVVSAAREAEAEVRRLDGVPRGLLRVAVPVSVPEDVFAEWMIDFLERYPEVRLELVASSVHVDLVAEGFDVALRGGPIEDESLVARTLVRNRLLAAASPRYLEQHGTPEHPEQLSEHNCILGYRAGVAPEQRWPLYDGGWVAVSGTLVTNKMAVRAQAAKRHLGIVLVVDYLIADALENGELIEVLPNIVGRAEPVSLIYADRTFLDPKIRAFIDFMVERVTAIQQARNAARADP